MQEGEPIRWRDQAGAALTRGAISKGIRAPGGTARTGWWQAEEKKDGVFRV
jgi:hypothetical protein